MKNLIGFLLCCLCLGNSVLYAGERLSSTYCFSHLSSDNGLSQSNVKAIIQDSYGFMWFGTKNGLNRYDGSTIVQVDCYDAEAGVGDHNISALFEDRERKLWVGTDRGVYRYDPFKDTFRFIDLKTEQGIGMDNWVANIVADSVVFAFDIFPRYADKAQPVRLQGLEADKMYRVQEINLMPGTRSSMPGDGQLFSGEYLMNVGLHLFTADKLRSRVVEVVAE